MLPSKPNIFQTNQASLGAHLDKIEMFLPNSAHNVLILPEYFPELRGKWEKEYHLEWSREIDKDRREWVINGRNDHFMITFSGKLRDITHNAQWIENPFSHEVLSKIYHQHCYGYFGKLRITDGFKTNPAAYMGYVSNILRDIEILGFYEKPRILEFAIDICGDAEPFRKAVRLAKDNPLDLCHYREEDRRYYPGDSYPALHTEYSMHKTFQPRQDDHYRRPNRYHRELVCYPRPDQDLYRIELRLGYQYLDNFYESNAYQAGVESSVVPCLIRDYRPTVVSRTLDLIGFLPYFVTKHLKWECINLEKLYKDHPEMKNWDLKHRSVRHIRYVLFKAGFNHKQIRKYTLSVQAPCIHYILPTICSWA